MIVVGTDEKDMALAANTLARVGGGQVVIRNGQVVGLVELTLGGLMSTETAKIVAGKASMILKGLRDCGCELNNPNMQLSLLALVVILVFAVSLAGAQTPPAQGGGHGQPLACPSGKVRDAGGNCVYPACPVAGTSRNGMGQCTCSGGAPPVQGHCGPKTPKTGSGTGTGTTTPHVGSGSQTGGQTIMPVTGRNGTQSTMSVGSTGSTTSSTSTTTSGTYIGGFIGRNFFTGAGSSISNCYSTGPVSGGAFGGGFIGTGVPFVFKNFPADHNHKQDPIIRKGRESAISKGLEINSGSPKNRSK